MTSLNTIFDNNFDDSITTKPNFYNRTIRNPVSMLRGVVTLLANTDDEIIGIIQRNHYDPESYDGYICWVVAQTLSDARNIIKGLKKVASTLTPTDDETVMQWETGDWEIFGTHRFIFRFIVLVRKSGLVAY